MSCTDGEQNLDVVRSAGNGLTAFGRAGMVEPFDEEPLVSREQAGHLVRAFRPDLRLVRVWPMAGAVSSQVAGIEVEGAGGVRCTLVLRQYGAANVEAVPHIADNEYRLLKLLSAAGLPVPQPFLVDESGAVVPGSCLLMEFIDGKCVHEPADLPSFTRQLAAALAAVHDCGIKRADVAFLPDIGDYVLEEFRTRRLTIDGLVPQTAIGQIVQANWPPPQVSEPVVLHGDYWPGNVLWRDGRLIGVVDWEEAAFGDAMADLANIRLEIVWHFGTAAMDMLTNEYLARRPAAETATLPVWDLRAALRACEFPLETLPLPADEITSMRRAHREFAVAAMNQL
jgi:aminoglycoside phosphotransferase (APT) family kinase protein